MPGEMMIRSTPSSKLLSCRPVMIVTPASSSRLRVDDSKSTGL